MSQGRLVDLARLSIETEFVKTVKFDSVIQSFAKKKTRKAFVMVKSWKLNNIVTLKTGLGFVQGHWNW